MGLPSLRLIKPLHSLICRKRSNNPHFVPSPGGHDHEQPVLVRFTQLQHSLLAAAILKSHVDRIVPENLFSLLWSNSVCGNVAAIGAIPIEIQFALPPTCKRL
jgi:hypothetical protein